eukprot:217617_1
MSLLLGFSRDTKQTEPSNTDAIVKSNPIQPSYNPLTLKVKDEEIVKLSRQNESLKKQISSLEIEMNETESKYSAFEQQSNQQNQLHSSATEITKYEINIAQLNNTIKETQQKNHHYQRQMAQLNQVIKETQQKLKTSEKHNRDIHELTAQIQMSRCKLDNITAQKESLTMQVTALKTQSQHLLKQNQSQNEEIGGLRLEMERLKTENEAMEALEMQINALNIDNANITQEFTQLLDQNEVIAKYKQQQHNITQECDRLVNQNESQIKEIDAIKAKCEEITKKNESLKVAKCKQENALKTQNKQMEILRLETDALKMKNKESQRSLILQINAFETQNEEFSALKTDLEHMTQNNAKYKQERLSNQNEMMSLRLEKDALEKQMETLQLEADALKMENKEITQQSQLQINAFKTQTEESEELRMKIETIKAQNRNISNENERFILEITALNEKKQTKSKKEKITNCSTQIRIAKSETARLKSLLLCCKPQIVDKHGKRKEFGFVKFLQTNLSNKTVDQLFNKFKQEEMDAAQLLSILTLTVIIYKVKLHQLQTGHSNKPKLNSSKIKQMVKHLAVYIIRRYGTKMTDKEDVCVQDDDGNKIEGAFYGYTFTATKNIFAANISQWIENYTADDGTIPIHQ